MTRIEIERDAEQTPPATVARADGQVIGAWIDTDTPSWVQPTGSTRRRTALRGRVDWQEAVLAAAGGRAGIAVLASREARDELVAAVTGVPAADVTVRAGELRGAIRSARGWSPVIRVRSDGNDITARYRV